MRKPWYEHGYLFEGVMLALAAINGWLAHKCSSTHPTMAFVHAAMALALVVAVLFGCELVRRK
jgi:hypothetical protein